MKRNFTLAGILLLAGSGVFAQFIPNTGQAFQLAPSYNPAFAGIENFGDAKVVYRYQWIAFRDAPRYLYASYHAQVKKPFNPADRMLRPSHQAIDMLERRIPKIKRAIIGMGGHVYNETRGPLSQSGVLLNAAFHYPLGKKTKFSAGLSAGIDRAKLNMSKITLAEPDKDELYNRLISEGSSYASMNMRAGVLLYHADFYLGFSYLPLFNRVIRDAGDGQEPGYYKGVINAGWVMYDSPDISVKPAVMALLSIDNELHFDYGARVYLRDRLWGGLTYRDVKAVIIMVGLRVNETVGVSYSYERSLENFNQFNHGNHELVLGLRINNLKKENPYVW